MTTVPTGPDFLTFSEGVVFLSFVVGGALLAGVAVIVGRKILPSKLGTSDQATPMIRSWIAISLVFGLLVLCIAAFVTDDSTIRSTLLGGLIASVSAAVAFYFSSKSTEQAVNALGAAATANGSPSNVTATPPTGTAGVPYSYTFSANGLTSAIFSLVEGATKETLQAGLVLGANGTLQGTTQEVGSRSFNVIATAPNGATFTQPVTIVINASS